MRRWLKYLLSLMFALAFWNCKDGLSSTVPEEVCASQASYETVCNDTISSSESELCLPRQISNANPFRVQTSARRATCHSRANVAFTKSGKIINAGLRYFKQKNSIITHSSLLEPSHRLFYLCKLII